MFKGHYDMRTLTICVAICLFIGIAAFAAETNKNRKAARRVDVNEFAALIGTKDAVLLDVRTDDEFKEGHIKDSKHIDLRSADFEAKIAELDKTKTYLV
jgi:predicted sulfurtransferase